MPEYLAPGVFVEEVSYRSKSIEGVPTSTTGFAGLTRFGPVAYENGPKASEPRLVTSYAEFERVYGGLTPLQLSTGDWLPYLAHSARAFFLNGGRRLYVSRIFGAGGGAPTPAELRFPIADAAGALTEARFAARWLGFAGNVAVTVTAVRGGDVGLHRPGGALVSGAAGHGTVLEVVSGPAPVVPGKDVPLVPGNLRVLHKAADGTQTFVDRTGAVAAPAVGDLLLPITVNVLVTASPDRQDSYPRLGLAAEGRSAITRVLSWDDPADDDCMVVFEYPSTPAAQPGQPTPQRQPLPLPALPGQPAPALMGTYVDLLLGLVGNAKPEKVYRLANGSDGDLPSEQEFRGREADPDDVDKKATSLEALAEIDDIAIVAMPDAGAIDDADLRFSVTQDLVVHAESCRYRIAVVDGPQSASLNEIRSFRGQLRHQVRRPLPPVDRDPRSRAGRPAPGVPTRRLLLPPSGFVSGHLRAQRHHPRRLQGPGQRGGLRPHPVRDEHQPGTQRGAQPRAHQRAALLPGPGQPGLGSAHAELGPRVDVRQRPATVHLSRALDRQGDPMGGLRAQRRGAVGIGHADGRGLPRGAVAQRRPARGDARGSVLRAAATAAR